MKTIRRNLLVLAMGWATITASVHAAETEQARIPYQFIRMIADNKRVGVFKIIPYISSTQDGNGSPPLTMYIDSKVGKIPLTVENGEIVNFPTTDELLTNNPFAVVNRRKGTVSLKPKLSFEFKGDYSHPYRCEYRDLMGVCVAAANVTRRSENKPPLSAEEFHGWVPTLGLIETNGVKAVIQVNSKHGTLIRTLCKSWLEMQLEENLWRENPTILLAFKPDDLYAQIANPDPKTRIPYIYIKKLIETKRVGIISFNPQLAITIDPKEWPPLEIYIDAKSGHIPLHLKKGGEFRNYPVTDALTKENPEIVVNRPPGIMRFSLNPYFQFEGKTNTFKFRYRDLFGSAVYAKSMALSAVGEAGQSVNEMEGLPPITLEGALKVEIRTHSKAVEIEIKKGEKRCLELDKNLWQENPEVIFQFGPGGVGSIDVS